MPEAYADAFWWVFLIVSLMGLFWAALRDDVRDALRDPDPTEDITKTLNLGTYTGRTSTGGRAQRRP